MTERIHGSCLCGAVRFSINAPLLAMGHCHCAMCRHAHGTAFSTYCQAAADALELAAGGDAITRYRSSPGASREFCRHCGGKLFYRADAQPQFVWIAAGAFDDDPGLRPAYHIFVASAAPWHAISDDLPQHDAFPAHGDH